MKNSDGFNDYDFDIGKIIRDSFDMTYGVKGTFFLSFLFYFLIIFGISFLMGFAMGMSGIDDEKTIELFTQVVVLIVGPPMMVGIQLLALKHARGESVNFKEIFNHYDKTFQLFLALLLMTLVTYLPLLVFAILAITVKSPMIILFGLFPVIYLALSYAYVLVLIVDKNLKIWEAMELSRKAVTMHWFKFFGLGFIFILIYLVSIIPLGIGLVWTIPMMMIAFSGILYTKMFD